MDSKKRRGMPRGIEALHDPSLNKGTAFTDAERDALGLHGLLPPRVFTQTEQVARIMENFRRKPDDLEKYIFLMALHDRNETLFYRVVIDHIEEMMPIIYTPTVGKACQVYGHIFRRPKGIYVSLKDRGQVADILRNWPRRDVRVIVVTDGERILGLGDLGANGMGISVGKLVLYSACAGVHPNVTLPITLDVGTNNEELRNDPLYIGTREARLRGEAYDELVDEFIQAVQTVFPNAIVQFEDFANRNAFRLLKKYRDRLATFNDDIQGTAAVTLAGIYSSLRVTRGGLGEQTILFLGAGGAAIGIGDLIVAAMVKDGLDEAVARRRCWFFDSQELVVKSRTDLAEHKLAFAHDHPRIADFHEAVRQLRPTVLVGVSGQPHRFTQRILESMAAINERPIVFALSNPTSKSECTAEETYRWTEGRAIFASGSPFNPVTYDGKTYVPGQGNNAYIFPGVGLGAIVSQTRCITDDMFSAAARALAHEVSESDLAQGCIFPPLKKIRDVSKVIAAAIAEVALEHGLTAWQRPADLASEIESQMYEPVYRRYV